MFEDGYCFHPHLRNKIEYVMMGVEADVVYLSSMKRETGENPVRTRHRNKGVMAAISLGDREDGRSADL